jgi:chorismate dehydratase
MESKHWTEPVSRTPVTPLRFGAADFIANRPLLCGLRNGHAHEARLTYEPQASLVDSFERGRYDAALVPSIEYLRGAGRFLLPGPALVGRSAPGGVLLVSQKPLEELQRVAVGEYCRTPVAALRIILAEQQHVFPDLLVEKRINEDDWRDRYDAALITGDAALREAAAEPTEGLARFNVTEMWKALTKTPLVHSVWVSDEESRLEEIRNVLVSLCAFGLERLASLAEEIAAALSMDAMVAYDYLTRAWSYELGDAELEGLRALSEFARKYNLVRENRMLAAVRA